MKKRIVIGIILMLLAGGVAAYYVSLDAPQDFPTDI